MIPVGAMLIIALSSYRTGDKEDCAGVDCTQELRYVSTTIKNVLGCPIVLDDYYTIRSGTQEMIRCKGFVGHKGEYPVVMDDYKDKLTNVQDEFIFIGIKNGKEVVRRTFTIRADCCHIYQVPKK